VGGRLARSARSARCWRRPLRKLNVLAYWNDEDKTDQSVKALKNWHLNVEDLIIYPVKAEKNLQKTSNKRKYLTDGQTDRIKKLKLVTCN
jgi:hypothetical protein